MAPFFSLINYTDSNFGLNDGSITNIQVTGGVPNVLVNIVGPSLNVNYVAPTIPDQLNLLPGVYTLSVVDAAGDVGEDIVITIAEKPATILISNISDACNCPNCDCVVTVSSYTHNSNCFTYNLYNGAILVGTYNGCIGQEFHEFTGLCTGDYRIEAIELDGIQYTYTAGGGVVGCPEGLIEFDETSDPATIVSNWNRWCFLANTTLLTPGIVSLPTGLDPVSGLISNAPGTYFERGTSWDLGDFNLPMTEGDNVGPAVAGAGNYRQYYFNTAINKYVVNNEVAGGAPTTYWWMTFDPKADTGLATGSPTSTQFLTTSTNWAVVPLTANQYTIDASNNVVLASTKATFPTMIECIKNSAFFNGFYSVCSFNDFTHEVTIGSTNADDDEIGIVIAAFKDTLGVYGPVDVTHTLGLIFTQRPGQQAVRVFYNAGQNSYGFYDGVSAYSSTVLELLGVNPFGGAGSYSNKGNVRIKIEKIGNIINIFATQSMGIAAQATVPPAGSNPYNPVALFSFDLLDKNTWSDAPVYAVGNELAKFVSDVKIGYMTASQPATQFFDIAFSGEASTLITKDILDQPQVIDGEIFTEPCELCYRATNCDEPADTVLITLPANEPPLDLNATYVFNEFPDKCWTIEISDECGGVPGQTILLNTGFIDAVDTLGVEDDSDFNWKLIVESDNVPIAPRPAIVSNQNWFSGYGNIFNALWITQTLGPGTHPSAGGFSEYKLEFVLPLGFVPSLIFDLLTDNTAVVTLNGYIIGDTSNPATYPTPWVTPAQFTTTNPIHFNTGPAINTLIVRVRDSSSANQSNGFVLAGAISSLGVPQQSTEVTIFEIFTDCDDCAKICYELVDCEGILTTKQTDVDLSAYVGQVITLVTCPNTCWIVSELLDCPLETELIYLTGNSFEDCLTCLPSPKPDSPLVIKNRFVKPGYDTPGCSPEYVERISCQFSEALFQEAASRRYGIDFCCSLDLDKLIVKKNLLELKMITDLDACKPVVDECCPPCGTEASIHVFQTIECLAPTNTSAQLDIPFPIVLPNCVAVTLSVKTGDPLIPHLVTGTDCCGIPFSIELFAPNIGGIIQAVRLCVDLNSPYTVDPAITVTSTGNCDCDPTPPFDCFCVVPVSNDGLSGFFAGNLCDGTPFDLSILGSVAYESMCVRADGLFSSSPNVDLTNLGDCTTLGTCNPASICEQVSFTNNSSIVSENVSFTLCIGLDRTIVVGPGQTSSALCVVVGSIAVGPNTTINQMGLCS